MMEHLYSPWRMSYIEGDREEEGCIFCNRLAEKDDSKALILHRGEKTFAILNRYPYNNGHILIVPYQHVSSLEDLETGVLNAMMQDITKAIKVLRRVYNAENFNVGINIGAAAGAGIAEHIHIHILPRWPGDTNFLTVTAATRVLPEALERTYARIKHGWDTIDSEA